MIYIYIKKKSYLFASWPRIAAFSQFYYRLSQVTTTAIILMIYIAYIVTEFYNTKEMRHLAKEKKNQTYKIMHTS